VAFPDPVEVRWGEKSQPGGVGQEEVLESAEKLQHVL
jgi:hypothetical protein